MRTIVLVLAFAQSRATLDRCLQECGRGVPHPKNLLGVVQAGYTTLRREAVGGQVEQYGRCPVRYGPTQIFDGVDGLDVGFDLAHRSLLFSPCAATNWSTLHPQWYNSASLLNEDLFDDAVDYAGQGYTVQGEQLSTLPEPRWFSNEVVLNVTNPSKSAVVDETLGFWVFGEQVRSVRVHSTGMVSFATDSKPDAPPQRDTLHTFLNSGFWPYFAFCALCTPGPSAESESRFAYAVLDAGGPAARLVLNVNVSLHVKAQTDAPTAQPTLPPTDHPTPEATPQPTEAPVLAPTATPTRAPSEAPVAEQTSAPSAEAARRRLHVESSGDGYWSGNATYQIVLFANASANGSAIRVSFLDVDVSPLRSGAVVGLSSGVVPEWKALAYDALDLSSTVGCVANENCTVSGCERPLGPTKPPLTRPHPWAVAAAVTAHSQFCEVGCAYYYRNWTVQGCDAQCDAFYRYEITAGYNDRAEVARYECRDGCAIANLRCQPGFYCQNELMRKCPTGTYRDVDYYHVTRCDECPHGRYRETEGGRTIDACVKCAVGRYRDATGSTTKNECLACPPGRFSNEEGMKRCKCTNHYDGDFVVSQNGTVDYDASDDGCVPEQELNTVLRPKMNDIDWAPRTTPT